MVCSLQESCEELVAGAPSQRNWKGVGIACLVILFICSLIAAAVFLLTPNGKDGRYPGTKFNLSELLAPKFSVFDPGAIWLSAHVLAFRDENRSLWKLEFSPQEFSSNNFTEKYTLEKLLDSEIASKYVKWIVSPDTKYAAMFTLKHKYTRRSSSKSVQIFETKTSSHKPLHDDQPIKLFKWAPISYPAALAFVDSNNDIWYQKDAFDPSTKVQITNTGADYIYNGVADWLYEEEIFETDCAMYFSTSGSKLAYVTLNDTLVKRINLEMYSDHDNYPEIQSIPYPKVGETLPAVSLRVYLVNQSKIGGGKHAHNSDWSANKTIILKPPKEVESLGEYYLITGNWLTSNKQGSEVFQAIWSNRVQNISHFTTCDVPNKFHGDMVQCQLDYIHYYYNNWITPSLTKVEYSSGSRYFTVLPYKMSDGYLYAHLAYFNYSANSQNVPRFVTSGFWEVTDVVGFDPTSQILYFIAAYPTASARHLMKVSLSDILPISTCLSCHMAKNECNYVSAIFPPAANYYVLNCQGPGIPKTYLRSVRNETIRVLSNNTNYAAYISTKLMPIVRYDNIDLGEGYVAQVKLLLPPQIETATLVDVYSLILKVYSGPSSQLVLDSWAVNFDTYLVSYRNYIVAYIDARGGGNRGSKYTEPLYHHFGTIEISDQIMAMKLLENVTSYIRRDSIAVWGWSYGGFAAAHIVKQDKFKTFKCAASVAPVTNFLYYDAAYTERYMGTNKTTDNYDGYKKTIVSSDVSAFALGKFLLAHGTGDDNVHFQNSAILAEALAAKGIQFQFMAYTNQQHSISDNTYHLYTMLDNFFLNCFQSPALLKTIEEH